MGTGGEEKRGETVAEFGRGRLQAGPAYIKLGTQVPNRLWWATTRTRTEASCSTISAGCPMEFQGYGTFGRHQLAYYLALWPQNDFTILIPLA